MTLLGASDGTLALTWVNYSGGSLPSGWSLDSLSNQAKIYNNNFSDIVDGGDEG